MKIKTIIASALFALVLPVASVHADDPIIPITTLEDLNTYAGIAGNYSLADNFTLAANLKMKNGFNLDLNGHTITAGANTITVSGTVKLKDSSETKEGKITNTTKQLFQVNSNANLTIESGFYESSSNHAVLMLTGSTFNMDGGTVSAPRGSAAWGYNGPVTMNINGGTLSSSSGYTVRTSYDDSVITMNDGLVTADDSIATMVISGSLTINGGKVYSKTGMAVYTQPDATVTMNDGTLQTDGGDNDANCVNLSKPGGSFTMNGGEIIATNGPEDPTSRIGGSGVVLFKQTSFTMNGGKITARSAGVAGNGSVSGGNEGTDAKVTINDGEIYSQDAAIYIPQPNGLTNISGGTITGGDIALEIRAGTLNITGGTFTGGPNAYYSTSNYNGTTGHNAAIVVAQHDTKLPITVNICGGTFKAETVFSEANPEGTSPEDLAKIKLNIGGETCTDVPEFIAEGGQAVVSEDFDQFIYGGRYSTDVEDYIATGYGEILESDNMNAVYPYREATPEPAEDGTVELDYEKTVKGTLVTIKAQPKEGYEVDTVEVVDTDGNNIPVENMKYYAPNSDTFVTVAFKEKTPEPEPEPTPTPTPTPTPEPTPDSPTTNDNILDYLPFAAICIVALGFAISSAKLAKML